MQLPGFCLTVYEIAVDVGGEREDDTGGGPDRHVPAIVQCRVLVSAADHAGDDKRLPDWLFSGVGF